MNTSRRFQTNFNKKSLSEFWYEVSKRYFSLGLSAVATLLPSGSTYFCENTFISHGIQQNQAQNLPVTGDELHTLSVLCHLESSSHCRENNLTSVTDVEDV
jgi:hypothetical protein